MGRSRGRHKPYRQVWGGENLLETFTNMEIKTKSRGKVAGGDTPDNHTLEKE